MRKVAIVGADRTFWKGKKMELASKNIITDILKMEANGNPDNIVLISGGCPQGGVDIWAEQIAKRLNIKTEVYHPEVNQWSDENGKCGFCSRNKQIAFACDVIYDIEPKGRRGGGTWTLMYAKKIGKKGCLIEVCE